jgi:hypothetical protein
MKARNRLHREPMHRLTAPGAGGMAPIVPWLCGVGTGNDKELENPLK